MPVFGKGSKSSVNPSYLVYYLVKEDLHQDNSFDWIAKSSDFRYLKSVYSGKKIDKNLIEALNIYFDDGKRIIINSFLIANCELNEISETLELDEAVIEAYCTYLFISKVFKSKLDKLSYINSCGDNEKETYLYSLSFGKDFVKWRICGEALEVSNLRDELRELFTLAKYNAKVASMNPITGDNSKEALKWMNQSVKLAEVISKNDIGTSEEAEGSSGSINTEDIIGMLVNVKKVNDVKSVSEIKDTDEIG